MRLTIVNQFYKPDISPTASLAASVAEHRAAHCGDLVTVVTGRGSYIQLPAAADADRARRGLRRPLIHRVWTPRVDKASVLGRLAGYAVFYAGAAFRLASLPRQDVIISLTTPPYIAWVAVLHKLLHRQTKLSSASGLLPAPDSVITQHAFVTMQDSYALLEAAGACDPRQAGVVASVGVLEPSGEIQGVSMLLQVAIP